MPGAANATAAVAPGGARISKSKKKVVLLIMGACLLAGLVLLSRAPWRRTPTRVEPAVCAVDPENGEAAITAAINSCPDGTPNSPTVVRFLPGKRYTQANRIEVRDRNHLVVDGNGSTFTTTANGCTTKASNGNWHLLRGRNITLRNMTSVGSFNIPGPRSLASAAAHPCVTQGTMNYGVFGTQGVWLIDVKGFDAWGDAVTLGPAHYLDPLHAGIHDYANDVHILRMDARRTARHCWAPTSGVGVWIEDSTCIDAWYLGLDAETDTREQPLRDHHYLRNTFDGFGLGGLIVPIPGPPGLVGDIEISGNRFLTAPDVPCNQTLQLGAYPATSEGLEFTNVTVEGNELRSYARAISLDRVRRGVIRNNRIDQLHPGEISSAIYCAEDRQVIVTNSTDVVVEGNLP